MIASKIEIYDGTINDHEWNYYLRGGSCAAEVPEKLPSFLHEKTYKDLWDLSNLTPPFKFILKEVLD